MNSKTEVNAHLAPAEDMDTVMQRIWTEYESSLIAGDGDRWIELWVDDGVQMPPGQPYIEGKAAIKASNDAFLDQFDIPMFQITNLEVKAADGWAFARGVYAATFVPRAGGDAMQLDGKYMTILQKQSDGSWKIYRDIFNSSEP